MGQWLIDDFSLDIHVQLWMVVVTVVILLWLFYASVEAECENPETKSTGREGANTWVFGAAPGNLRRAATDWWSNEDSNHGPACRVGRTVLFCLAWRGLAMGPPMPAPLVGGKAHAMAAARRRARRQR
jgi:hypothetical protein